MSIINKKIRLTGNDINIPIGLNINDDIFGYQEQLDKYANNKINSSINNVSDAEVIRYKFIDEITLIRFYFPYLNNNNTEWNDSYIDNNFTISEIVNNDPVFKNSFYILDLYDNFESNNQNKISSVYLNQLSKNKFLFDSKISSYAVSANTEFYNLFIPNNFTGDSLYGKFYFFNAKTGSLQTFNIVKNPTNLRSYYVLIKLDRNNKIWSFNINIYNQQLSLFGQPQSNNPLYYNKLNNSINKVENKTPQYSSGDTFNYQTGKYINF